mmetsp:Transcript_8444/g.9820  ORF Transcript_8444/g.9820 Transcript_8444/m.9820 type:complete len:406 (+) Transcript_8444:463-1680(+)
MEVSELVASLGLDGLARAELSLDLASGDRVVARVELIQEVVLVLRDGDGLELALLAHVFVALCCHFGQVDGSDGLDAMEVVVVGHLDVRVVEGAAHRGLSDLVGPGVAVEASGQIGVLGLVAVAGRLQVVVAFHLHALDEGSEDLLSVGLDVLAEVLLHDFVDEGDNGGTESLAGGLGVDIGHEILLLDGRGGFASHVAHVTGALHGKDGVSAGLVGLDVLVLMPIGLSDARRSEETVLGAGQSERGHVVVPLSGTIVVDRVVLTEQDGAHKDLTLDSVSVLLGVLLGHHATEGVASDEDVVALEACLLQLLDGLVDVGVNEDRVGGIKEELGEAHPDFLVAFGTLRLDLARKGSVGLGVARHAVDPDDGHVVTAGARRGRQDRHVGVGGVEKAESGRCKHRLHA